MIQHQSTITPSTTMPDGVAKVMDTEEWQHEAGREDVGESQLDVALTGGWFETYYYL